MSKPAAQGLDQYNLPGSVEGGKTFSRADQGALMVCWGQRGSWLMLSVLLVNAVLYMVGGLCLVGFLTLFSFLQDRIINLVVGGLTTLLLVVSISHPTPCCIFK